MSSKQSKRIQELEKALKNKKDELARLKKAKAAAAGGGRRGNRANGGYQRFAQQQLDPFSRAVGAKWPDSNGARTVSLRLRTIVTPEKNSTYDTIAFAIRPSMAALVWSNPTMSSAEIVSDWNGGTATAAQGYTGGLASSAYTYRIVSFSAIIKVIEAALTAAGRITVISGQQEDTSTMPVSRSALSMAKQDFPFSAGKQIKWISKPVDNQSAEFVGATGSANGWQACQVFCTGLSGATAKVDVEVRMDIEVIPAKNTAINQAATDAEPYNIGKMEAISNYAARLTNAVGTTAGVMAATYGSAVYQYARGMRGEPQPYQPM